MLEVVAAALIDRHGRVLLQQRRADRQHGGLWEFPGGKREAGESAVSALIRELDEELGVAARAPDLQFLAEAADPAGAIVITLYTCRTWAGAPRCLDAAAIGWFLPDEFAALAMPPLDIPLAASLKAMLEKG